MYKRTQTRKPPLSLYFYYRCGPTTTYGGTCVHPPSPQTFCHALIPKLFSIKDEIVHYNAQRKNEEEDPKADMPDDVEEQEVTAPEPEVQPEDYEEGDGSCATYADVRELGDAIDNMCDLAISL